MNPEVLMWLASGAGAAIFLLLGALVGGSGRTRLAAECVRLRAESEQQRHADFAARVALQEQAEGERAELARCADKIGMLESALEQSQQARTALLARQDELQSELQRQLTDFAPDREAVKTLRHDLALARELVRQQDEKTRWLEEANGVLRAEIDAQAARAARNESLEREVEQLRARGLAADLSSTDESTMPAHIPAPAHSGLHAFDKLALQLLRVQPVRSAVIADDLGLVISSQGSHGDELAALGALFNRACNEARRILPLGPIQRIVLEDAGHICVSMRPLHPGASSAEDQLTLVTLAQGFEPDPVLIKRILLLATTSAPAADAVIAT